MFGEALCWLRKSKHSLTCTLNISHGSTAILPAASMANIAPKLAAGVFRIAWEKQLPGLPRIGWLLARARNVIGNEYKGRRRRQELVGRLKEEARSHVPESSTAERFAVAEVLMQLRERDCEVLMPSYWDDLTGAELGQAARSWCPRIRTLSAWQAARRRDAHRCGCDVGGRRSRSRRRGGWRQPDAAVRTRAGPVGHPDVGGLRRHTAGFAEHRFPPRWQGHGRRRRGPGRGRRDRRVRPVSLNAGMKARLRAEKCRDPNGGRASGHHGRPRRLDSNPRRINDYEH